MAEYKRSPFPSPIMTRLLFLAAFVAAPVLAQTPTDDRSAYRADLDRLGQNLDQLDRSIGDDMRADYTTYRESYDQLRTDADGTDMSDPEAAAEARMQYDQLSNTVYRARLTSAPTRDAYLRAATDRMDAYDAQIGDLRMRYQGATGDMRSDYAQDLISLRRQRDMYRNEVYSTRGMTRSGFDDAARRRATDALTRYDTDFNSARRDAMMRSMPRPANGSSSM